MNGIINYQVPAPERETLNPIGFKGILSTVLIKRGGALFELFSP